MIFGSWEFSRPGNWKNNIFKGKVNGVPETEENNIFKSMVNCVLEPDKKNIFKAKVYWVLSCLSELKIIKKKSKKSYQ